MSTATATRPSVRSVPTALPSARTGKPGPRPITWEAFQRQYLRREDGYKYEWVDGMAAKSMRNMDKTQLYILHNLQNFFRKLLNEGKVAGDLITEPDLFFLTNHRRPDIAWLTTQQIYALAEPNAYEVPAFLIEVVSSNDQSNAVKKKMLNYRDAGVQTVWQIFPELKQVDVYSGPELSQMTVCSGEKICSAAPALPAFEMSADAIFDKPSL
jgi:Uma2 family endonuclease